jgi:catechol 2,3-dioxygenase-like lactoylglutathione lyase family enzyme
LIRHLGLTVRDPQRSADFYRATVGLDAVAHDEAWGVRLLCPDGFMIALIRGEPLPTDVVGRVHFGSAVLGPEHARDVREQLRVAGVRELEWEDSASYIGIKFEDPDGYVVELYCDIE